MRDKDMSDGSVNEQGRVDSKAMSLTSTCSHVLSMSGRTCNNKASGFCV